jgi:ketosteroid isomerase-like protein
LFECLESRGQRLAARSVKLADISKAVSRIIEGYQSSVHAKDVAAFMRLYDPHVRVFDAWGHWSHEGAEAWSIAVEAWFTSLGSERVKVLFSDVTVHEVPGAAVVSAIVTYAGIGADGTQLREMQNRLTWALQETRHVLRIVHEHTSAPIGFEDQKAILVRKPGT